jgi:hypothetical protein
VVVGTVVVELIFVVAFVAIIMLVVLVSSLFADPGSGLSEHTITLTPESLTEVTSLNTNVVKWGGVRRVVRLRNYLAMYVGRSVAHVVPRRAFATAQEWERFCDLALDSFRASQSQSERTAA